MLNIFNDFYLLTPISFFYTNGRIADTISN